MSTQILLLDKTGFPVEWTGWQNAVMLQCKETVLWSMGGTVKIAMGGVNKRTQLQTYAEVPAIIAVNFLARKHRANTPPLTNHALFARDGHICLYCAHPSDALTRDHVTPRSKGGTNTWMNVVAACSRCNHAKANRTPEEADMPLIALPYAPNHAEHLVMLNKKRILVDQMDFLAQQFSANYRP